MTKQTLALLTLSSLFSANQVMAAEAKTDKGLHGSGEAGYSETTGNTNTEALYASLKLDYTQDMYKVKAKIDASNKKEDGNRTEERYVGDLQGNLYFSDYQKAYGFGQFRAENNRFEDIELNTYTLVGLGYNFIKEQDLVLTGEAGIGNQTQDYTKDSGEDDFSQLIGKLYGNFEYGFNANVRFLQNLTVFTGEMQTKYESNTGLKVKLNGNLNLKLNYQYRHNDNPATGKKKDDTETMLTLMYDF